MNANGEIGPDIAGQVEDAIARLSAAKAIRPPNHPIPSYELPDALLLDSFVRRLQHATAGVVVYEATSIQNSIPLPDLSREAPSHEHLAIYDQIAQLRVSLQALSDKAVVAGYRPLKALPVPTSEVAPQMEEMKALLEDMKRDLRKAGRASFSGIAVSAGVISVDLRSVDALASRMLRQLRGERDEIDAAAVWETSEELAQLALELYVRYQTTSWAASDKVNALMDRLRGAIGKIGAVAQDILALAIAWRQKQPSLNGRATRPLRPVKVPRFDLAIDLGCGTTRIYARGRGLILSEASLAAVRKRPTGSVMHAVGDEVRAMVGKTPRNIDTVQYLRRGGVYDEVVAKEALRFFLKKAGVASRFGTGRALVTIQTRGSATNRRGIEALLASAGLSRAALIDRPLAAALGAHADITQAEPHMVIDVGAGSSDVAIYEEGTMVIGRTAEVAAIDADEAIIEFLHRQENLIINYGALQRIKASLFERGPGGQIDLIGGDIMQGVPRQIIFTYEKLESATGPITKRIAEQVREVIEAAPASVRRKLNSATLVGGGALIPALAGDITNLTGLKMQIPDDPIGAGIRGCGRLLAETGLETFWSARGPASI